MLSHSNITNHLIGVMDDETARYLVSLGSGFETLLKQVSLVVGWLIHCVLPFSK